MGALTLAQAAREACDWEVYEVAVRRLRVQRWKERRADRRAMRLSRLRATLRAQRERHASEVEAVCPPGLDPLAEADWYDAELLRRVEREAGR